MILLIPFNAGGCEYRFLGVKPFSAAFCHGIFLSSAFMVLRRKNQVHRIMDWEG